MASRRRSDSGLQQLDLIDKLTLPAFAITMFLEHRSLRKRRLRELPDIDFKAPPDNGDPEPDELVPLGFEKNDTFSSLTILAGSIVIGLVLQGPYTKVDQWLFDRRVSRFGLRRGKFVAALVFWDFLYYVHHRLMHRVRLFWADHEVHHSGRRYNLSTALRQSWNGYLTHWIYLPMPLLGFAPRTIAKARQLNLLYQYWIHTEAIDRLPAWFEKVFNTPSHHRVHHGANKQYIDRNYAGIFIVWDRLFKTFEPEVRQPVYGLTTNITSFNPVKAAYHELANLTRDVTGAQSPADAFKYVFAPPGWAPNDDHNSTALDPTTHKPTRGPKVPAVTTA